AAPQDESSEFGSARKISQHFKNDLAGQERISCRSPKGERMTDITDDKRSDLIWGCAAIAKAIGRGERATFHLLERQLLPAKRIGGRWCASKRKLLEALTGEGPTQ